MRYLNVNYWGRTRYWWLILLVGILLVAGGFAYWLWPGAGYAVASQLFGWLLVAAGVVQLCVSSGSRRPRGWGWWLAGGVIDIFAGFMLVRSVVLSEVMFPYFLAFIFVFWGIGAVVSAVCKRRRRYWWLYLVNGILMMFIGFFFIEAGYLQNVMMVSFLASLSFIYWGFSVAMIAYDMRPGDVAVAENDRNPSGSADVI